MRQSNKIHKLLSDKLILMGIGISTLFIIVIVRFYKLQIIENTTHKDNITASVQRTVDISALRGNIYDRYGKPLVVNKSKYVLKIDPQVIPSNKKVQNEILIKTIDLLEKNEETYIDVLPISKGVPFTFTEDTQAVRRFITNYVPYNNQEHKEELYTYSPEQLMAYLRGEEVFDLEETISDEDARKIISVRLQLRQTTYQKYKNVTICEDLSMQTVSTIEENQSEFPGITVAIEPQRYYNGGRAFGNIVGYTRHITASQYETLKEQGYDEDDIVGQVGIEGTMESELKGEKGYQVIEVDNVGRTIFTKETKEAINGNDIYLTLDANLQEAVFEAVEKRLSEAIVKRLKGGGRNVIPLTGREVLVSMATNNQLDFKQMKLASEDSMQRQLYEKINTSYQEALVALEEGESLDIKQHFYNMLHDEQVLITNQELLLALSEQGSLKLSATQVENIKKGQYGSLETLLIEEFESGDLKPDQTNIMPFSGSAVVVDINTGETLALVGYPSFDSNDFTQNFNEVYSKLYDGVDARNLEINRALKTARAPGSTFKMLVAVAGIEEGVITEDTVMNDTGFYTKAGKPYPRCWHFTNNGYGHGNVDLKRALEVSCNYYFYDIPYRLGLKYGAPYGAIETLTKYVEMFGLHQKTGIELEETMPNVSDHRSEVYNRVKSALKNLISMSKDKEEQLLDEIAEYVHTGFYPIGNSVEKQLDKRIDYLSANEIKKALDDELSIVLGSELERLYSKMVDDFKEVLEEDLEGITNSIVDEVLAGDTQISLKIRSKIAIRNTLLNSIQLGTRKTLNKMLGEINTDVIKEAYYNAYETLYRRYSEHEEMKEVALEIEGRMSAIKANQFDELAHLSNQIFTRIINVYLDDFFKDIDMEWTMAINIRTAIGQGKNAFTPVQMARYIAGLANGKEVYDLKIVNGIYDHKDSGSYVDIPSKHFNTLDIKESTLKSVYEGMLEVTKGNEGSSRSEFRDFPIDVAGKTGTAEGGKYEDSWFVGFAPYDNPQIAVVTTMYEADGLGSLNTQLARDIFEIYFDLYAGEIQNTSNSALVE